MALFGCLNVIKPCILLKKEGWGIIVSRKVRDEVETRA